LDKQPRLAWNIARMQDFILIVLGVNVHAYRELSQVSNALSAPPLFFCTRKSWQKHRCENGDDGDNDKQFD
jgi:hypothetical protein